MYTKTLISWSFYEQQYREDIRINSHGNLRNHPEVDKNILQEHEVFIQL